MNCLYCDKKMSTDRFDPQKQMCHHNDVNVVFSGSEGDIYVIHFEHVNRYSISLFIKLGITVFYSRLNRLLAINRIIDITPDNFVEIYDRYTKLIAFS